MAGIQNAVEVSLTFGPEGTFGTALAAGSASAAVLRRTSSNLALGKDTYTSQEARADLQIADMRHGTKRPAGAIEGELSNGAYDSFIEALLRGTWANGTSSAASDYTTIAGAVTTGTALQPTSVGTLTWAAGNPVTKGFRAGDVVRLTGTPGGANDATNFRIISFSGANNRTINVTPAPVAFAATAVTSMNMPGKKLLNGTVKRSFTIEQQYPTIAGSELFTGMRCGSGQFRLPPNGLATGSFAFMGQDMQALTGGGSPYFTNASPAGTQGIYSGPVGSIRAAGGEQGIVTGLEFTINNNLSADPVVGANIVPDIFYGQCVVTGTLSAFLQDFTLMNAFVNETEVDVVATLVAALQAGQTVPEFLSFSMQRVKFGGATKQVGASGGVIVTYPFQALLASAGANNMVDAATMTIQRSS